MEFDRAVAELDTLVATLEREGDERSLMLLELIDAIHRPALELLLAGHPEHELVQAVLSMYDLAPLDPRIEVEEALGDLRPYIDSHGGNLEVLSVQDGVVHLRMSGSCDGCAASEMTLRRGIERRLRERVPGFREVIAHDPHEAQARNGAHGAGGDTADGGGAVKLPVRVVAPRFQPALALEELAPGELRAVEVQGQSVLLLNVEGEPYAYRNTCPAEPGNRLRMEGGRLAGTVLVCPWHNCAYDARSGLRVDDRPAEPPLVALPLAVRGGSIEVAVNAG